MGFSEETLILWEVARRAKGNTTVSMRKFVSIFSQLISSKNSGRRRYLFGPGVFADSSVVRAVRFRALAGHNYEIRQSKTSDATEFESEPSSSPELNAITDHLFLPEKEELDKLLRYEAMINRQLNHAIAELERLQLRRKAGYGRSLEFTKQSQEVI